MGNVRLALAALVFTASLIAAVLVLTAPAKAAWSAPASLGRGEQPRVRAGDLYHHVAWVDGRRILVRQGDEPHATVAIPRAGRLVAHDIDSAGRVVALREDRRTRRLLALIEGGWRRISPRGGTPVDAQLAVAESGAAAAVWLQDEGRRRFVYAAVRGPNGRRFLPARRISGPVARTGQALSVAVDDAGDAAVAFTQRRDLYLWRLGAAPVKVHDATGVTAGAFAAAAGTRDGTAVVVFTRLEDREPPRYRATAALQRGDGPLETATIAQDVSPAELFVDRHLNVLTATAAAPYAITALPGGLAHPATQPPADLRADGPAVAWTEDVAGFAVAAGQRLRLGRAAAPDVASAPGGRAIVAWDTARGVRAAVFTP